MKVKICGIKTFEVAQAAIGAGADFLGFNFMPTSKRFIKPEIVKEIIKKILAIYSSSNPPAGGESRSFHQNSSRLRSNNIKLVGVFMDEKIDVVNKLINYLKLDFVQLHGSESSEYAASFKKAGIIKTFSLPFDFDVDETMAKMKTYKVDYFLLDRQIQGEGELLNSVKVRKLASTFPIILAGGLTVENVADTVRLTKPQMVDVASGVEINGVKNKGKIIEFIKNAKMYE